MTLFAEREAVTTTAPGEEPAPNPEHVPRVPAPLVPRPTAGLRARLLERRKRVSQGIRLALQHEEDHGHLFHFVPVFLGAGAVLWFSLARPPPTIALIVLCVPAVSATLGLKSRHPVVGRIMASLALLILGMLFADIETRRRSTTMLDSGVTTVVTGTVEQREAGANGEWRYILRLTQTADPKVRRPPERISLLARGKGRPAALGETLTGRARLSPPSGPALPGLNDFAFASYFDGVGAVGFFLGAPRPSAAVVETVDVLSRTAAMLASVRDGISMRIRSVIEGDPGAFAASIITGERRSMSKEATEALRLSGLAHITAISGLNMALAAGICFVGLRMLLSLMPGLAQSVAIKKIAAAGALLAAFAYLLISGYQVSAVRAFLMTAIMLVAVLFDRPAISLRNLALAAIVIIATTPSAVMGPSFQMSFAATAALIAGYAAWRARPRRQGLRFTFPGARLLGEGAKLAGGTFLTSLIGGLSTAVFAIAHFHRLAPHGLEANLAAMPIISILVMPAGLMAMLLMPLGLDAPFLVVMGIGLEWVLVIAHAVAGWDEAIGFSRPPGWFLPLASVALLLMTLLRTRLRHLGTLVLAMVIVAAALAPKAPPGAVLISEDGRLVGLSRAADVIATNRPRPPRFIFEQWQAGLGRHTHMPPVNLAAVPDNGVKKAEAETRVGATPAPATFSESRRTSTDVQLRAARTRMAKTLETAAEGRFFCDGKLWCVARLESGWTIATIDESALAGAACDVADVVISSRRLSFSACRSGARLLTAETLRRTGAVELFPGDHDKREIRILASFEAEYRPWSVHRLYDWRSGRFEQGPRALQPAGAGHEERSKPAAVPERRVRREDAKAKADGLPLSDSDE